MMSREFDGVDDNLFGDAISSYVTNSVGSISGWFYIRTTEAKTHPWFLPPVLMDDGGYLGIHIGDATTFAGDRIYVYNWDGGADTVTTTYSLNTWTHVGWVHTGGNLEGFKDGVSFGTTASGNTSVMTNEARMGRASAGTSFLDGFLDHVATWDVGLTDDEMASLGAGISPLFVRNASLTSYMPLHGLDSPERNFIGQGTALNFAVTGATRGTTGAPVIPPRVFNASIMEEVAAVDVFPDSWFQQQHVERPKIEVVAY